VRVTHAVIVGLLLVSAGCLTGADETAEEPEDGSLDARADPNTETDATSRAPEPGPLEAPPSWIPGEYWTIEIDSTLLEEPITWTRVVAGYGSDAYLLGQPADQATPAGLLLHVPGLGAVDQDTLSYGVHGDAFQPTAFPLEEGQAWQTSFEGDPVNATVTRAGDVAEIAFCCSRNITATYDPSVRAISSLSVDDGFLAYEVTDHGYAYEGDIEVPTEREVVFLQARAAGALTTDGSAGPPAGQAQVPEAVDRVAFTQIVGNLDMTRAEETGAYLERAQLPNGSTYTTQRSASTDGLAISFHEAANASGTWTFDHVAGGPGLAFTEGIGYQLETRTLG
jgi:hypothetical protein